MPSNSWYVQNELFTARMPPWSAEVTCWHSGGDRLGINKRTIANTPNSPYPHVVLNETASLR
ncbi:MAG: hypothetical protein WAM72_16015, partial [Xanthobacteraceae bacterium]